LEIKQARKFWLFLTYFQSDRLVSGKTLSELHIHSSLATRVYYHAGCTKYCKNFTVALKMIDVIDKEQMHDSVTTGEKFTSEDWTCVISMFLKSVNIYFVYGHGRYLVGDTGDIICDVPPLFIFRFSIWRSSKNKSDICHVLCEVLIMLDVTHSQVDVETEFGVVLLDSVSLSVIASIK